MKSPVAFAMDFGKNGNFAPSHPRSLFFANVNSGRILSPSMVSVPAASLNTKSTIPRLPNAKACCFTLVISGILTGARTTMLNLSPSTHNDPAIFPCEYSEQRHVVGVPLNRHIVSLSCIGIIAIISCAPVASIVPPLNVKSSAIMVPICSFSSVPVADIFT